MLEIRGHPGYFVTARGQVWSGKRKIFLSEWRNKYGYSYVLLCTNGVAKNYSVHRLVAVGFISNPANKLTVNHKNGVKHDNRVCNLEWATMSENNLHRYRVLKVPPSRTPVKVTDHKVRCIKKMLLNKESRKQIASRFRVSKTTIDKIVWGQRWRHVK